jgi:hypothetical protein
VQAVEQHAPWAQMPELHSVATTHGCPFALPPQLPLVQVLGDVQSLLVLHVVLQTLLAVSQVNGSHSEVVTVLQFPDPSQVRSGVSVEPEQLPATQTVPFAHSWQLPAPLQTPLVPQVALPVAEHWAATIGA